MQIKPFIHFLGLAVLLLLPVSALIYRHYSAVKPVSFHCSGEMRGENGDILLTLVLYENSTSKGVMSFSGVYRDKAGGRSPVSRDIFFSYSLQHSTLSLSEMVMVKDKRDLVADHDFQRLVIDTDKDSIKLNVRKKGDLYLFTRNIFPTFFCTEKTG